MKIMNVDKQGVRLHCDITYYSKLDGMIEPVRSLTHVTFFLEEEAPCYDCEVVYGLTMPSEIVDYIDMIARSSFREEIVREIAA